MIHNSKFFTTLISRIFDPFIIVSLLIFLTAQMSMTSMTALLSFLLFYCVFMVLPLIAFLVWAMKTKRVSNWDVSDRRQRLNVFCVCVLLFVVGFFLLRSWSSFEIIALFELFLFWFVGMFGITLFWKISGHVALLTLAAGYCMLTVNLWWGLLFVFVPLVAWARVASNNHTHAQVIAGFLYSLIFLGVYTYFVN